MFDFEPKALCLYCYYAPAVGMMVTTNMWINPNTNFDVIIYTRSSKSISAINEITATWSGNTVKWYGTLSNANYCFNSVGATYYYIAIY